MHSWGFVINGNNTSLLSHGGVCHQFCGVVPGTRWRTKLRVALNASLVTRVHKKTFMNTKAISAYGIACPPHAVSSVVSYLTFTTLSTGLMQGAGLASFSSFCAYVVGFFIPEG